MPTNIQFYDEYSPLTYFIALIDDKCEICSNQWVLREKSVPDSNICTWAESIGKYTPVNDKTTIRKIENTMTALKAQMEDKIRLYTDLGF